MVLKRLIRLLMNPGNKLYYDTITPLLLEILTSLMVSGESAQIDHLIPLQNDHQKWVAI